MATPSNSVFMSTSPVLSWISRISISALLLVSGCSVPASPNGGRPEARMSGASVAAGYSVERMGQRLQELAENPFPSPEALAEEFGDVPNYSSVALRDFGTHESLSLTFDPRALCVRADVLSSSLSEAPWTFRRRNSPFGDHYPANVYHERTVGDRVVRVSMEPASGYNCIGWFSINRFSPDVKPRFPGE